MRDGLVIELDLEVVEQASDRIVNQSHVIRIIQVRTIGFLNTQLDSNLGLVQLDVTVRAMDFKLHIHIVFDTRSYFLVRSLFEIPLRRRALSCLPYVAQASTLHVYVDHDARFTDVVRLYVVFVASAVVVYSCLYVPECWLYEVVHSYL